MTRKWRQRGPTTSAKVATTGIGHTLKTSSYYDKATWQRGNDLAQANAVKSAKEVQLNPDDIVAYQLEIRGSGWKSYIVNIRFSNVASGVFLNARCSCPVTVYCKHSVAALIELGFALAYWPSAITFPAKDFAESAQAPRFVDPPVPGNQPESGNGKANNGALERRLDQLLSQVIGQRQQPQVSRRHNVGLRAKLTYHIALSTRYSKPFVQLATAKTNIKADGSDGASRIYTSQWPQFPNIQNLTFLSESDLEWADFFTYYPSALGGGIRLHPKRSRDALLDLVEAKDVYWQNDLDKKVTTERKPLRQAEHSISCRLIWQTAELHEDTYRLSIVSDLTDAPLILLPMQPPLVIDMNANTIGAATQLPIPSHLEELIAINTAKRSDWQQFIDMMREEGVEGVDQFPPLPEEVAVTRFHAAPQPTLYLKATKGHKPLYDWQSTNSIPYGEVKFTYCEPNSGASGEVVAHIRKPTLRWRVNDQVFEATRDGAAEQAHLQTLVDLGLIGGNFGTRENLFRLEPNRDIADFATGLGLDNDEYQEALVGWAQFFFDDQMQSTLRDRGWTIIQDKSYPIQMANLSTAVPSAEFVPIDDQPGWFDYDVRLEIDGQALDFGKFLPQLLAQVDPSLFLNADDDAVLAALPRILILPTDEIVAVDWPAMLPILRPLMAWIASDGSGQRQSLARSDVAALSALYDPGKPCPISLPAGQENLTKLIDGAAGTVKALPKTINATLRPYQHIGVDWLSRLAASGFGGILADDMGLGKTLQCISFIAARVEAGEQRPALIVAPKSVLPNWEAEFEKFAPRLKVRAHHGSDRINQQSDLEAALKGCVALITSYPVLTKDKELLSGLAFSHLILDEAQAVKNPAAKVTHAAGAIKHDGCFALSGTPLQNNLGELWSLANLTNPGLLRDVKSFNTAYRKPIEKAGEVGPQVFLNAKLRPFMLRRDKTSIADELPEKVVTDVFVDLEDKQKAVYEAIRISMDKKVRDAMAERGLARSRIQILEALLRLRQVCCDPALLADSKAISPALLKGAGAAKLSRLEVMLDEMLENGRRILVFSQFTSMLDRIELMLDKRDWRHMRLDGQSKDRGKLVKRFQEGDVPLFLISLKAGGVGLNLTAADTVIHFDPWWNPAVEDQATDRAYRIGQDKAVFVYRLLAKGSVEEAINLMQTKKRALADSLFNENSDKPLELNEADIELLLRPIA